MNKTGREEDNAAGRRFGERDELAKRIKTRAEERAEESSNPGEGVDIIHFDVAMEIRVASMNE